MTDKFKTAACLFDTAYSLFDNLETLSRIFVSTKVQVTQLAREDKAQDFIMKNIEIR